MLQYAAIAYSHKTDMLYAYLLQAQRASLPLPWASVDADVSEQLFKCAAHVCLVRAVSLCVCLLQSDVLEAVNFCVVLTVFVTFNTLHCFI